MPDTAARGPFDRRLVLDRLWIGGLFGTLAGILAATGAVLWVLLGPEAPGGRAPAVRLHLLYVPGYTAAGGLIGVAWPLRRSVLGHWFLWCLGYAMVVLSLATLVEGPPWTWRGRTWSGAVLATMAFALAIGGLPRRRPPARPSP